MFTNSYTAKKLPVKNTAYPSHTIFEIIYFYFIYSFCLWKCYCATYLAPYSQDHFSLETIKRIQETKSKSLLFSIFKPLSLFQDSVYKLERILLECIQRAQARNSKSQTLNS